MCTAVLSFDPGSPIPVLLAGIRDEFADRPWQPPGAYWPRWPGLIGGRDLQAGGTWLALDPATPRVATVLNAHGREVPAELRLSRGELPLRAAADGKLSDLELDRFDPFHLLCAEPAAARLWSWDGAELAEQALAPGLHMIVNSGLEGAATVADGPGEEALAEAVAQMAARIAYFRPQLLAARRPEPRIGTTAEAWEEWLPLMDGGGLDPADRRALLLRRDFGDGRLWGTSSVSLVALSAAGARYDFTGKPGDPDAWALITT